jgi:hypothetical protein
VLDEGGIGETVDRIVPDEGEIDETVAHVLAPLTFRCVCVCVCVRVCVYVCV